MTPAPCHAAVTPGPTTVGARADTEDLVSAGAEHHRRFEARGQRDSVNHVGRRFRRSLCAT